MDRLVRSQKKSCFCFIFVLLVFLLKMGSQLATFSNSLVVNIHNEGLVTKFVWGLVYKNLIEFQKSQGINPLLLRHKSSPLLTPAACICTINLMSLVEHR